MKNVSFLKFSSVALLLIFISACTDVPLSFSTAVSDQRILGYWQTSKDEAIQFSKNSDGTATLTHYEYDDESKKYEKDGDASPIYFTTIKENGETFQFISIEMKRNDRKCYTSARYYFSASGDLTTQGIDMDFLKKNAKADKDDIVTFGKTDDYQAFVKKHLKDPELFEKAETLKKLDNLTKK